MKSVLSIAMSAFLLWVAIVHPEWSATVLMWYGGVLLVLGLVMFGIDLAEATR